MNKKVELLAPAGSLLKLKVAIDYGADAVYCAGKRFGLRTASENFSYEDFEEGLEYAHTRGVKVYVTLNVYPRNDDFEELKSYIAELDKLGVDAVIVSDLGMLTLVREIAPDMEIHISTQANNVNWLTAKKWTELGAKRVVLARELSCREIAEIGEKSGAELEAFVHGAMCVSYSGRCLLSNYMTGRDSNKGDCAQPCRWKYSVVEEKRPGEYFPVTEDENGTFIFNSKDLCLIKRIPELVEAGVYSFKIEGRVKSEFYVATIVSAYRKEIDRYLSDPENYVFDEKAYEEVCKVSHRAYFEGFFGGRPSDGQVTSTNSYERDYEFIAYTEGYDEENKLIIASQRNKFYAGDEIDILVPVGDNIVIENVKIFDENMNEIADAPHSEQKLYIPCDVPVPMHSMIRKKIK
ncbi:MAG: U32 family peptidase [Clostridia bacterium]|nr:U32 family peptidase [Clostridia bacterium]